MIVTASGIAKKSNCNSPEKKFWDFKGIGTPMMAPVLALQCSTN